MGERASCVYNSSQQVNCEPPRASPYQDLCKKWVRDGMVNLVSWSLTSKGSRPSPLQETCRCLTMGMWLERLERSHVLTRTLAPRIVSDHCRFETVQRTGDANAIPEPRPTDMPTPLCRSAELRNDSVSIVYIFIYISLVVQTYLKPEWMALACRPLPG